MKNKTIKTAESVTEGHPDKLCDSIADAVLDACLRNDPNARVACEVMATAGKITVAGEITVNKMPDIPSIVCRTVWKAGYGSDYEVEVLTHEQSLDIMNAVNKNSQGTPPKPSAAGSVGKGATRECAQFSALAGNEAKRTLWRRGDQGIVYGYACNETDLYLPLPVVLAHRLTRMLTYARRMGTIPELQPDGKSQVSVEYENGAPKRIAAVVLSAQHEANANLDKLKTKLMQLVIRPALQIFPPDHQTEIYINPSGRFVQGGFEADTGLTGRKLMVDTYGGLAPHGGGALSGKDATKIDRSGTYMARYIAKNIVTAGLAEECTVSLAYAIGKAKPIAVTVDTHNTGKYDDEILEEIIPKIFDLTPAGIISLLNLSYPIYAAACNYGHFTHDEMPWEQTKHTNQLWKACWMMETGVTE